MTWIWNKTDEEDEMDDPEMTLSKALAKLQIAKQEVKHCEAVVRNLKKTVKKPEVAPEVLAEMEKIIITEAQKGNTVGTVRTYISAYRQKVGIAPSVRLPSGWVTNLWQEHYVEKPQKNTPVKTPVKAPVE